MLQEFWVIGGKYRDVDFSALEDGGGELYGPFASYDEAYRSWVDRVRATRALAEVRYQIVTTADRRR
jgi:hypothetical protein